MSPVDGWVVEKVSDDPSISPLQSSGAGGVVAKQVGIAAPPLDLAETKREFEARQVLPEPIDDSDRLKNIRTVGRRVGAVAAAVLLIIVGALTWSVISRLLEPPDVPSFVATIGAGDREPTQRIVVDGDDVILEGTVPSEAVSDTIEGAAVDMLGRDRVINNFELSPDAFFDPQAPVHLTVAETVQFVSGRADVAEQYGPLIDLAVEMLENEPGLTITIIGHTDARGDDAANLELSLRRAEATAERLARRGIDPSRLEVDGMGETKPIASNDTEAGRQANRRVEFLVTGLFG